jgi:hypothetical protein
MGWWESRWMWGAVEGACPKMIVGIYVGIAKSHIKIAHIIDGL